MAAHKITLTYGDDGELTATHRTWIEVGGHVVSHAETVSLDDHDAAAAALEALINANRDEMEARTERLAIAHAAAVEGKDQPGIKPLRVGGSLGAIGTGKPEKKS